MAEDIVWTFHGYITPGGTRDVQQWFDGLEDDAKDAIRDALAYLQHVPHSQWRKPEFEPLGKGLSEVRAKAHELQHWYRIYGFFWPEGRRYVYTFLLGHNKKERNPRHEISEARKRMGSVETGIAGIHEFNF